MTVCSCTFRINKLTGCLIESSVNITVNIQYLKNVHWHVVFKKDADSKCQKEANNQEDEISEQSLKSQRTEENGEYMLFSSL